MVKIHVIKMSYIYIYILTENFPLLNEKIITIIYIFFQYSFYFKWSNQNSWKLTDFLNRNIVKIICINMHLIKYMLSICMLNKISSQKHQM